MTSAEVARRTRQAYALAEAEVHPMSSAACAARCEGVVERPVWQAMKTESRRVSGPQELGQVQKAVLLLVTGVSLKGK